MKGRAIVIVWAVAGASALGAAVSARGGQGPASAAAAQSNQGLVLGRVIDADSGAAVAGAVVTLAMGASGRAPLPGSPAGLAVPTRGARAGAGPKPEQVMADGQGRFVFHDLPAGSLRLTAKAPGYLDGELGETRPGRVSRPPDLAPGERLTDATIRLWKYAVLGGVVTDEAGEPAVNAQIAVYRRTASGGRLRYTQVASATTDDRGIYRAASLEPGEYLVAAPHTSVTMPRSIVEDFMNGLVSGTGSRVMLDAVTSGAPPPVPGGILVGDLLLQQAPGSGAAPAAPPSRSGTLLAYPTVYYPAATSAVDAATITLQSGEEQSDVSLQLRLVPTARITGQVLGPAGPMANVAVHLRPAAASDLPAGVDIDAATTLTTADGTFTFLAVPEGQYTADVIKTPPPDLPPELASSPIMKMVLGDGAGAPSGPPTLLWAEAPVTVADADVSGVALTLHEGATVSGRFEFDDAGVRPTAAQLKATRVRLAAVSHAETPMLGARTDAPDETGAFKTTGQPPGKYDLEVLGAGGWRAKSIVVDGQELIGPLTLSGEDITNVVVTLTTRLARIDGSVRAGGAARLPAVTVIVFPTDQRWWAAGAQAGRAVHTLAASADGRFSAPNLLAGDYYVAALDDAQVPDVLTTAFLESAAAVATRVTLADGEQRTLDVTLGAIK